MSTRKVQFAESTDDDLEAAFAAGKSETAAQTGDKRFKGKHSLDSDEEDVVEDNDVLEEDDIEGIILQYNIFAHIVLPV